MKHWEFSSVEAVINFLAESMPRACEAVGERYSIPFFGKDEVATLQALDKARKAYDQKLSVLGHESEVCDPVQVHQERIFLNSLRKWQARVNGYVQDDESPTTKKLVDVTRTLARQRKRDAIDGFVFRNSIAKSRLGREDVLLLGEMAAIVRVMLSGFMDFYWDAEPRFGTGSVHERIPMLARWERLSGLNLVTADLDWALATCKTEARLCAVPKQWDKDRLITVEPFESTFLQHKARLALGRTLCKNGFRSIVDQGISGYDGPRKHRHMALDASAYASTRSTWGTLDLTDASDGITWEQVSWIFPPEVMAVLDRGRSMSFSFKRADGTIATEPMHMYGGMGNATTFMVESIVFYALMRASVKIRGRAWKGGSVVGDDLLVNGFDQVDDVLWGLTALGYKVNLDKSFFGANVPVRESCGCWAFNGFDVYVPAYLGYTEAGTQLLALAEYIRNGPEVLKYSMHQRLGDWVNTPVPVANTVSVCDATRDVTYDRIRWNRRQYQLEVRCLTAETPLEYVPADYECTPGGAFAVLTRQVSTSPMAPGPKQFRRFDKLLFLVRAARRRLGQTYTRIFIVNLRGKVRISESYTDLHEDHLDALMLRWTPGQWKEYRIAVADPYRTRMVERWVSCVSHTPEVIPLARLTGRLPIYPEYRAPAPFRSWACLLTSPPKGVVDCTDGIRNP